MPTQRGRAIVQTSPNNYFQRQTIPCLTYLWQRHCHVSIQWVSFHSLFVLSPWIIRCSGSMTSLCSPLSKSGRSCWSTRKKPWRTPVSSVRRRRGKSANGWRGWQRKCPKRKVNYVRMLAVAREMVPFFLGCQWPPTLLPFHRTLVAFCGTGWGMTGRESPALSSLPINRTGPCIQYVVWSWLPYFLKYSRSKIFAVDRNLCSSEIIRASKFRGWVVSAKINTPRKLSIANVNES